MCVYKLCVLKFSVGGTLELIIQVGDRIVVFLGHQQLETS